MKNFVQKISYIRRKGLINGAMKDYEDKQMSLNNKLLGDRNVLVPPSKCQSGTADQLGGNFYAS